MDLVDTFFFHSPTDRYLKLRELERDSSPDTAAQRRLAVVGCGRLGQALVRALDRPAGSGSGAPISHPVIGPLGRGADGREADAVLLCVPDQEIAWAAALIAPGRLVGHCSGATGLEDLAPHEGFTLHPLMTVAGGEARSTVAGAEVTFTGAGAAVDGSTPRALEFARRLALLLGMRPVHVAAEDRALYHAAASMASNFLVTLEAAAERVAAETGVDRDLLAPLVRASVENWAAVGGSRALTGPVARGDEDTVRRQRDAVAERAPDLVELFDALVEATRALAGRAVEPV